MQLAFEIFRGLSFVAFISYGVTCVFTSHMRAEFERYGLSSLRRVVGALEVAGALGLLAGIFYEPLTLVASGGLALLMVMGLATRLRVRDSLFQMLPAFALLLVNGFVFAYAFPR